MTDKFYKLTEAEWRTILSSLTRASDIKLLLHIKVCDPFNDRDILYSADSLAKELGLTKRTIQRSIKDLEAMGLIELLPQTFGLKVKSPPGESSNPGSHDRNVAAATGMSQPMTGMSQPMTGMSQRATGMSLPTTRMSRSSSETPSGQGFQISKTNKTNKTNTDSLSDSENYFNFLHSLWPEERESWKKFVQEKIAELPIKPCLLDEWLIALSAIGKPRWESLKGEWENVEKIQAYTGSSVPTGVDALAKGLIDWLTKLTSAEEVRRNLTAVVGGWVYGTHIDQPLKLDAIAQMNFEQIKAMLQWRAI